LSGSSWNARAITEATRLGGLASGKTAKRFAAQVVELAWQLEGRCGQRQVPSARLGLALNIGGWVGSDLAACAVHILQV